MTCVKVVFDMIQVLVVIVIVKFLCLPSLLNGERSWFGCGWVKYLLVGDILKDFAKCFSLILKTKKMQCYDTQLEAVFNVCPHSQETMNPKDIMTDAIHNFHPQYQQYTQYSAGMSPFMHT